MGGKHLMTNGMAWCPVSHTSATQQGGGNLTNCVWKEMNEKTGCLSNEWVKGKVVHSCSFSWEGFVRIKD